MTDTQKLFEAERLAIGFCESRRYKEGGKEWRQSCDAFTTGYRLAQAAHTGGDQDWRETALSLGQRNNELLEENKQIRDQLPPNEQGKNRYGLDVAYFRKLINRELNRSLVDFTPDELARVFARASRTADPDVMHEPEFSRVGGEAACEIVNRRAPAAPLGHTYTVRFFSGGMGLPDGTKLYTAPPAVVPEEWKTKVLALCSAVENDDELPPLKYALKCGRLINEVKEMLTAAPQPLGDGEGIHPHFYELKAEILASINLIFRPHIEGVCAVVEERINELSAQPPEDK